MNRFSASGSRVVVGVDGSPCSQRALLFAADEARLRGLPLHVVTVYPMNAYGPSVLADFDPHAEFAAVQRGVLADCADELAGLTVVGDVLLGGPAECLVDVGRDATLLVVGNRGHGNLARMVLGSVSHAVVQHAECPVVVVHTPHETEANPLQQSRGGEAISAPLL